MEKKTFKTKVKEFYKKHEVAIIFTGMGAGVLVLMGLSYKFGKDVGIEKVLNIELGKYNLSNDNETVAKDIPLTVRHVLHKYFIQNEQLVSMKFVNRDKL